MAVSFPSSPQLHSVSILGLQLLALTGRKGARYRVHTVKVCVIPTSLLLSQELITEQIRELYLGSFSCNTEEEGVAMVSLLERCNTWRGKLLFLFQRAGAGELYSRGCSRAEKSRQSLARRGRPKPSW